jgi:hypothetical protein
VALVCIGVCCWRWTDDLPPPPRIVPKEPGPAAPLCTVKLVEGVEAAALLAEALSDTVLEHRRGLGGGKGNSQEENTQ